MEALGIDVKLLIGQIINFLILMIILWRFAYKPVLKMLNDRRAKVAESLENAKKIEEDLKNTEAKTAGMISEAQAESEKMVENSKKMANEQKAEIVAQAKDQAEKEVTKAKAEIDEEKESAAKTLQKEMLALVKLATEKIIKKESSAEAQKAAIAEAIEELGAK